MFAHIDSYDDLTVDEVKDAASDLSHDQLQDLREHEADTKGRVTLLRWVDDRLDELDPESETVVVTSYRGGYAAGVWFDAPLAKKEVERTTRIERAIEDGTLVEVHTRD